jgi:heat shock protein 4
LLLAYLKQLTEADLGGAPVADCVISVPFYFSQAQRCPYLAVAGLRPLRLMHDLAAPMPKVEEGKERICEKKESLGGYE